MPGFSASPPSIREEAKRWFQLADDMANVRTDTAQLYLGRMAFFPGGMTIAGHSAYESALEVVTHRMDGGAVEFELVGMVLRSIADDYEQEDEVTSQNFRASERQLERATDEHGNRPPPGPPDMGSPPPVSGDQREVW